MSIPQTKLERLENSGNEHYDRKEYSIAVECYRAAMEHGMNAHSPLFKYGYSLAEIGNYVEAVKIYQKAITAGVSASAHNNLGLSLQKLDKHQEARDAYRMATQIEPFNVLYWRNLAECLSHLKEQAAELAARRKLVGCNGHSARDWNLLGCAIDRDKDNEGALAAFRKAAYLSADACYFTNMALIQSRLGQSLDAYHACRHALKLNATYSTAVTEKPKIEAALKLFPQSLKLQMSGEIGPHDYVNPYVLLDLTETDEQPEAYEWFDQPTEWEELLGSLNRRRRKLKAELELNDGALAWLPELSITDEVVHRVLADLDDDGWHANHWAVFRMPMLKRFLMFGELDYFYSRQHPPYPLIAEIAGADTDDYEHEEFIEFISPFFSHRLAAAIKASLDSANYEAVSALLATRLPVTATDYDEAIDPVRRHFAHRRELLDALEAKLEHSAAKNTEIELEHAGNEAKFLNMLPSQHGAKLCEDMCQAYRSISIALANHRDDYITSERALKAAENFNVSETTKGRLVADRTTIEGLINREIKQKQEEEDTKKRHTVKLNLKNWFRERTLEITPNKFSWGKETILAEKINGVRFGINAENSNSILSVHDIDGKIITTEWLSGNNFKTAVTSATALYSSIILEKLLNIINGGGEIVIGLATVDKSGISVPTGSTNQRLYPITYLFKWHQVHAEIASGSIVLKSIKTKSKNAIQFSLFSDDRNFTFMISCRDNWNAFLLPFLIKIMKPEAQKNEDRYYAEQKRASDKNKEERLQEAMIKVKRGEMHEIEYVLLKQRLDEIY